MTVTRLLEMIIKPNATPEECGIIGRNLWRLGLRVQEHRKRVEKEMEEIEARRRQALQDRERVNTGFVRRNSQWKRSAS